MKAIPLIFIFAFTGCATTQTGNETAVLQAHAAAAQSSVAAARHSGKEVVRLSGNVAGHLSASSGFTMRAESKTVKAIRTLRESLR